MKIRVFSDDEAERINRVLVPLVTAEPRAVVYADKIEITPVVQIDASNRPDVADFARVTRTEGIQPLGHGIQIFYRMRKQGPAMVVFVSTTDPVQCEFTLDIPYPKYRNFFDWLPRRGAFLITTGEVEDALRDGFGLTVDPGEIAEAIREWETDDQGGTGDA